MSYIFSLRQYFIFVLFLVALLTPATITYAQRYHWETALAKQLERIRNEYGNRAQKIVVIHLGINDRDDDAYRIAKIFSARLNRPVIALPSYSGNRNLDLPKSSVQYFNSRAYPVNFEKAWEQIVGKGHQIVGTIFHSGAGLRANAERGALVTFIKEHPDKVTGKMVFAMTNLQNTTRDAFTKIGINATQIGKDDFVSWVTKPSRQYIPFGEHLGPITTELGAPFKALAVLMTIPPIGTGISKHSLLDRQDEVMNSLQLSSSTDPSQTTELSQQTGGVDLSSLQLNYFTDFSDEEVSGLSYVFKANKIKPGELPVKVDEAAELASDSFFIWLVLPNSKFWVNLNPSEPDRVVDSELGKTDVGRIMLEGDFQMKKTVASLIHPDSTSGQAFWDNMYGYNEKQKTSRSCFSFRQWILPGNVNVWSTSDSIYILDAALDVKLESEYLKLRGDNSKLVDACHDVDPAQQKYAEKLFRETILPEVIKQVNTAHEYRDLRNIFHSRIIAEWYKTKHKGEQAAFSNLIDQDDITKWYAANPWNPQNLFESYVQSVTKGEFNFTRKTTTESSIYTRTYFYGGVDFSNMPMNSITLEELLALRPTAQQQVFDSVLIPTGYSDEAEAWFGGLYITKLPESGSSPDGGSPTPVETSDGVPPHAPTSIVVVVAMLILVILLLILGLKLIRGK